jgi:hypothetical protein
LRAIFVGLPSEQEKETAMALSAIRNIDLEKQVDSLSRELAVLRKEVSRQGGAFYADGRDTLSDYCSDIAGRISERLPNLRRQARVIEGSAREHPAAAAAVGIVVLGLVATLLFSRRR